jgi:hypothetical protein
MRMINIKAGIPELDSENASLFKASSLLEQIGNNPNPTATEFYLQLVSSDLPEEDHEAITLAAISIETMMNYELGNPNPEWDEPRDEPTVH